MQKASHLLSTRVVDQPAVFHLWGASPVAVQKTPHQSYRSAQVRLLCQPPDALEQHEKRAIASNVVRSSVLNAIIPRPICRSGKAIVRDTKIEKTTRRPTQHVCFQ